MVVVQKEEAADRVEYDMVIQEREVDMDHKTGGEVDEAHEAAEVGVAGIEAVALGEHHPVARVEAWVEDARADDARAPVQADDAESDVVLQVVGQHPPPDELHQICGKGRPILNWWHVVGKKGAARER
jgi:hypothetical protein